MSLKTSMRNASAMRALRSRYQSNASRISASAPGAISIAYRFKVRSNERVLQPKVMILSRLCEGRSGVAEFPPPTPQTLQLRFRRQDCQAESVPVLSARRATGQVLPRSAGRCWDSCRKVYQRRCQLGTRWSRFQPVTEQVSGFKMQLGGQARQSAAHIALNRKIARPAYGSDKSNTEPRNT
jgi:hypothetical protein